MTAELCVCICRCRRLAAAKDIGVDASAAEWAMCGPCMLWWLRPSEDFDRTVFTPSSREAEAMA